MLMSEATVVGGDAPRGEIKDGTPKYLLVFRPSQLQTFGCNTW
jgi:hypothetical protein